MLRPPPAAGSKRPATSSSCCARPAAPRASAAATSWTSSGCLVDEVVYLGFHQEVRVRLATGTLMKVDVPNEDGAAEREQGDAVSVHIPPKHLRVLAADDAVPA